jgi:DNA-binding CsgD family transcriptional regulator
MGESARLGASDYRALIRLVGECRDLGADPVAWRLHLLTALCARLGARVGAGGEATGISRGLFFPISTVDMGWENNDQRRAMFEWMELQARSGAPTGFFPLQKPVDDHLIVSRDDVFSDRQWHNSIQFSEYLRRSELDHVLVSFHRIEEGDDHFCGLTIMRSLNEPRFSRRDKAFVAAVHGEIAPLVGRQLAAAHEPSALHLSPRLRQVLDCLLEGDGEKQIAVRLGLTPQTVNQYVKAVYRHFRVYSRGELLARWIRRRPEIWGEPGRTLLPQSPPA